MNAVGSEGKQPRPVRKLRKRLDVARQLHDLEQDAALEIVDIERLRGSVNRNLWMFLAIGLFFTTTGVHDFLAGDRSLSDPVWWGSWGVEPCLAGILITVLRWEAAMIARDIEIDSWVVDWLKRFLLGCTLIMNVVPVIWPRQGGISPGMLAAHVMVPVLVFLLAEVMPVVQARCMQARRAVTLPTTTPAPAPAPAPATVPAGLAKPATAAPAPVPIPVPVPAPVPAPVQAPASAPVRPADETPTSDASEEPPALDGLGIPTGMQAQIRRLVADLDRPVTAVDIQQATRLPASIAARVAERFTPATVNGYAH